MIRSGAKGGGMEIKKKKRQFERENFMLDWSKSSFSFFHIQKMLWKNLNEFFWGVGGGSIQYLLLNLTIKLLRVRIVYSSFSLN